MKIVTTYYAKIKDLPSDIVPIAISLSVPGGIEMETYKKLAPNYSILAAYKKDKDETSYEKKFYKEVLDLLDKKEVVKELFKISKGKDIALVCYEAPDKFCHRHIVAKWLSTEKHTVKEF